MYGNTMPMWLNKSVAIRNVTLKLLDEQYSPGYKCKCLFVIEVYLEDEDGASIWMKMKWSMKPSAISLARTKELEINYWLRMVDTPH